MNQNIVERIDGAFRRVNDLITVGAFTAARDAWQEIHGEYDEFAKRNHVQSSYGLYHPARQRGYQNWLATVASSWYQTDDEFVNEFEKLPNASQFLQNVEHIKNAEWMRRLGNTPDFPEFHFNPFDEATE